MKSKQLAYVLIKLLGLSFCLYPIPSIVTGIITAAQVYYGGPAVGILRVNNPYAIGGIVQLGLGFSVMVMSREIAGWMFKNDED